MHNTSRAIIAAAVLWAGIAMVMFGLSSPTYAPAFRMGIVGAVVAVIGVIACVQVWRAK